MNNYLGALKKYAEISGRARRSEYCFFVLFTIVFLMVAAIFDTILGTTFKTSFGDAIINLPFGYLYVLYAIAVFIPGFAVVVRRLHDVGKSGWFMFIALVPLVGTVWLLVSCLTKGANGENEYGADPKVTD